MGRYAKNREPMHLKPVEKVELSEEHVGLRFAIVAILIMIAVVSFGYGIHALLNAEPGWTEIEANSGAEANASNEIVLMYNLGSRSDMSATVEKKELTILYTDVMERAYQQFHSNQEIEHVNNIHYINQNPNKEIVVDDMLYQAFELVQKYENRSIYLAPIYESYNNLFGCEDDSQTVDFDPYVNEQLASEYAKIAAYASDESMIQVELLGDNKIKLFVSEEYLKYCEENEISKFIDFAWMKNAFIVDYLAEEMIKSGYTAATISSFDGFSRNLDNSGTEFSFNIYDYQQPNVVQVATAHYSGQMSIVSMRNFPINTLDAYRYYEFSNGEIRNSYLDIADGLGKTAGDSIYAYADDMSCAEVMLQVSPIYISEELGQEEIADVNKKGIEYIFLMDQVVMYSDKEISLSDLYDMYTTTYVE